MPRGTSGTFYRPFRFWFGAIVALLLIVGLTKCALTENEKMGESIRTAVIPQWTAHTLYRTGHCRVVRHVIGRSMILNLKYDPQDDLTEWLCDDGVTWSVAVSIEHAAESCVKGEDPGTSCVIARKALTNLPH